MDYSLHMTSRPQHMDLVTSSPATSSVRTASTESTASTSRTSLQATTTTIPPSVAAVDARPARPGLVSRPTEISPTKPSRPRGHLSTKSSSAVPNPLALNANNNEKSAPTTTKPATLRPPKFGKMTSSTTGTPSAAAELLRSFCVPIGHPGRPGRVVVSVQTSRKTRASSSCRLAQHR